MTLFVLKGLPVPLAGIVLINYTLVVNELSYSRSLNGDLLGDLVTD